jgi:hypothetical protein
MRTKSQPAAALRASQSRDLQNNWLIKRDCAKDRPRRFLSVHLQHIIIKLTSVESPQALYPIYSEFANKHSNSKWQEFPEKPGQNFSRPFNLLSSKDDADLGEATQEVFLQVGLDFS